MRVERRQLEFFLAIAEAGSFTRAASRLRVAQPSLSYAIRNLEKELATPLFERLGRGVRLTPAGEALVAPARRTIQSFSLATGAVRGVSAAGFGRLTIVCSTLWAIEPLGRIVAEFRRLQPSVRFVVSDPAARSDVIERVRTGDADFGLLEGPAPGGAIDSQWLVDDELVAVLPPGTSHRLVSVEVADLVPHGLISTPRGTALRALVDHHLEAAGEAGEVAVETAHLASVIPLVLQRAGVAMLPEGIATEAAAHGARVVRLTPSGHASVSLVWRRGRLSGLGEQFVALAREVCSDSRRLDES